jgi:hypothetical protein
VTRFPAVRTIPGGLLLMAMSLAAPLAASAEDAPHAPAAAMDRLCDTDWPTAAYAIRVGKDRNWGKPLRAYDPRRPMAVYDVDAGRYLFGPKGEIDHVVGRFTDKKDATPVLKEIEKERAELWMSYRPPFIDYPGAYLVTGSPTCKITRDNPVVDKSSWILELDGVLVVGTQRDCDGTKRVKNVTVVGCDGLRTVVTDTVTASCGEVAQIDTCIHRVEPGVLLLEHSYSYPGGSEVDLRAYDIRKKKKVFSLDNGQEGGPETELVAVEDHDKDATPEIVFRVAGTDEVTRVLKWKNGKYRESKTR